MPPFEFDRSDIYKVAASNCVTDYDRANFLTYARILDALRFAQPWGEAAAEILNIDSDLSGALGIWSAHVDRANWLVADGLVLVANDAADHQHRFH